MAYNSLLLLLAISTLFILTVSRRVITTTTLSSDFVSDADGVHGGYRDGGGGILQFNQFVSGEETEACEQTYGFMPCTNSALGNLFLIFVYGYLTFCAATYLSSCSERLLQSLRLGLVGGLLLPIIGALPQAIIILASGVSGSVKVAQDKVSIGMGLLAGSTVMLLTILWGTCIVVGKCDIQESVAVDDKDTRSFNLVGSGVTTDIWTNYSAMIMAISVLPLIIVQLPQFLHSTSGRNLPVLIGLLVSICLLIAYCVYEIIQPELQKRRLAFAKHKNAKSRILMDLSNRSLARLLDDQGKPNLVIMSRLFNSIDMDGNKRLSHSELRALLVGLQLYDINLNEDDAIDKVMKDFDTSHSDDVEFGEFVKGIEKWLEEAKGFNIGSYMSGPETMKYIHAYNKKANREHYLLRDEDSSDNEVEGVNDPWWNLIVFALPFLIFGTLFAAAFANPLVDAVNGFSIATKIPSFFISFIVLPLATNSVEAMSAIAFAAHKRKKSASFTFSELYGAVTMNNILCLSVFLALVYVRGLTWSFSSEVLIILIVCITMGIFGSLRNTFPLWTSLIAFALYPFSIVMVYVFDCVFGWS